MSLILAKPHQLESTKLVGPPGVALMVSSLPKNVKMGTIWDNHPLGSWNIRISSPILVPNNAWVLGDYPVKQ